MAPDPPTPAPLPTPARATPDLRGGTVLMTCWREGDLDSILEIADDPASRAWSSTGDVHSVDDA